MAAVANDSVNKLDHFRSFLVYVAGLPSPPLRKASLRRTYTRFCKDRVLPSTYRRDQFEEVFSWLQTYNYVQYQMVANKKTVIYLAAFDTVRYMLNPSSRPVARAPVDASVRPALTTGRPQIPKKKTPRMAAPKSVSTPSIDSNINVRARKYAAMSRIPRAELEVDKEGIVIDHIHHEIATAFDIPHDHHGGSAAGGAGGNDQVTVPMSANAVSVEIAIRNTSSDRAQTLKEPPSLSFRVNGITVVDMHASRLTLNPGDTKLIRLIVRPWFHGYIRNVLVFDFSDFVICRFITIRVEDAGIANDVNSLAPSNPFQRKKQPKVREAVQPTNEIVPGEPPEKPDFRRLKHPLAHYRIPQSLSDRFAAGHFLNVTLENSPFPITPEKHTESLAALLHLEELQMHLDIRNYDMEGVEVVESGRYLALEVPGLAEKRPSVLYGDKVYVRESGTVGKEYEGCVHAVRREE
ncbi:hypothetical protein HK104_006364, partial [Borealophlyctis nickersoniae]